MVPWIYFFVASVPITPRFRIRRAVTTEISQAFAIPAKSAFFAATIHFAMYACLPVQTVCFGPHVSILSRKRKAVPAKTGTAFQTFVRILSDCQTVVFFRTSAS
ncbi:MAG TPA: hypothetical protein DGX96_05955 [Lachnospiraceae bacterium]|nr:hypothetical protein [Lachnospiraceae bacterium]